MSLYVNIIRQTVAGIALMVVTSGTASAQTCSGSICEASPPKGTACRIFFSTQAGSEFAFGEQSPQGCYTPGTAYALQGWRLHANEKQELSRIGITQGADGLSIAYTNSQNENSAQGYAWLMPLPSGTEIKTTTSPDCAGVCLFSLGSFPDDQVFVLLGFDFTRTSGAGKIDHIAVGPLIKSPTGTSVISVDFRDAEFTYDVRIDYALVPSSFVEGPKSANGSYRGGSVALTGLSNTTNAVLQGFSFNFEKDGRELHDIGAEPSALGYEAWFQSQQSDENIRRPSDTFDWQVDYLTVQ